MHQSTGGGGGGGETFFFKMLRCLIINAVLLNIYIY